MKNNIIYAIMALIIIGAFAYMAYGADTPTREEMKQNKIEQLKETNARIEMNNKIAESVCEEESLEKGSAIEIARYKLSCLEKDTKPLIDIEKEIEKEFGTESVVVGTSTASTVAVPERINLRSVFSLGDCRFTNDNHKLPRYKLEWLAYDIACEKGEAFDVSVPNYQAKENRKWVVEKIGYGHNIGNFIIIKSNTLRVVYGHTKPIEGIKEGDIVKSTFTIGETDLSGESTGIHLHLEIWEGTDIVSRERFWSETYESTDQTKLLAHRNWNFDNKYFFTHYDLGDQSQNDGAPCTGASGKDLCQMEKNGIKTMAITSDIRKLMGIKFGDTVTLVGDVGCAGIYSVQDEMNKRYRQTPGIKRPGTPYYIKGDIPSKEGGACYIIK